MAPKRLLGLTGFILATSGLVLMLAQAVWPDRFAGISKKLAGLGITLETNEVGFGVVAIGAILLLAASLEKSSA